MPEAAEWLEDFTDLSEIDLNQTLIVSGHEGSGKTHWAIENAPDPVYLVDTEGEHNLHTSKRIAKKLNKKIYAKVLRADPTISREKLWFAGNTGLWQDFKASVHKLGDAKHGTVIIDSASDLLAMVVNDLAIDWSRGDKAFPPMLYGQVYAELNTQIAFLRQNHNVILTAKLKEKWNGESKTGKFEMSLWNTCEYIVEHILTLSSSTKEISFRHYKQSPVVVPEVTWDNLSNGPDPELVEAHKVHKTTERIESGIEKIQEIDPEYEPPKIEGNSIQLEEILLEITSTYRDKVAEKKASRRRKPKS